MREINSMRRLNITGELPCTVSGQTRPLWGGEVRAEMQGEEWIPHTKSWEKGIPGIENKNANDWKKARAQLVPNTEKGQTAKGRKAWGGVREVSEIEELSLDFFWLRTKTYLNKQEGILYRVESWSNLRTRAKNRLASRIQNWEAIRNKNYSLPASWGHCDFPVYLLQVLLAARRLLPGVCMWPTWPHHAQINLLCWTPVATSFYLHIRLTSSSPWASPHL